MTKTGLKTLNGRRLQVVSAIALVAKRWALVLNLCIEHYLSLCEGVLDHVFIARNKKTAQSSMLNFIIPETHTSKCQKKGQC